MQNVLNYLKGYKTYIVAVVTVIYGAIGHHASAGTLAPYLLSGLGLASLRAAVAKVEVVIARIEAKLPASVQKVVDPEVAKVEADVNKKVAK